MLRPEPGPGMRRREFLGALGSAVVAWPVLARAQHGDRVRRIGVLHGQAESDPEGQLRTAAFLQRMQQLGWEEGRNIQIEHRFGSGRLDTIRRHAAELVALRRTSSSRSEALG
jgi:putative ABC transport system substrate-binding protein